MPFNGQCEDIFHQFRPGSPILLSLITWKMPAPVIPDILRSWLALGVSLTVFTGSPRTTLTFFRNASFSHATGSPLLRLLPVNPAGPGDVTLPVSRAGTKWLANHFTLSTIITWFYENSMNSRSSSPRSTVIVLAILSLNIVSLNLTISLFDTQGRVSTEHLGEMG